MAVLSRKAFFLVTWMVYSTVYLCLCCIEGEGHFGWRCDTSNGCFCKQGQRCQKTLGNCPENCVDNPWGIGCEDEPGNLAYGKAITQTSIYTEGGVTYPGTLAVDGDNSTDDLRCSRSNLEHDATWSVDLGGLYVIRKVAVFKPIREIHVCPFEAVELCINNGTGGGCGDITASPSLGPNGKCYVPVFEYSIDPPILASSVTIYKIGVQILRLCEVIVRGYTYPYNIALGKTASQSTTLNNAVASRAVDGNVDPLGSCTQTASQIFPWWQVDLGQKYVVYSVTLFNRAGAGGDQLYKVQIKVRNLTDVTPDVCVTHDSALPRGVGTELVCTAPIVGQVVFVQLVQYSDGLSLCEVSIKGYKYDDCFRNMLGPECRYQCTCRVEEHCNTITGCSANPYLTASPSVASRTQTSVTLSWHKWSPQTGSGVGVVQNYVIKAWRDGALVSNVTVPKDNDTWTIGRLNQYTLYNFTVSIKSDTGSGFPSPATTARTCGVPLLPPAGPNITPHLDSSKRSVYIELRTEGMGEADHRCDNFSRLIIRYEGEFDDTGNIDLKHVTQSQLVFIGNLVPYSRYTIRVSAVNNLDLEGPAVTIDHTTPEGVPPVMKSLKVVTVDRTAIEIEWRAPSPPGGPIVQYELSYRNQSNNWNEILSDPVSTSRNIENLQMNSTYQFRIRAKTTVGFGEYSDVLSQTTKYKIAEGKACDCDSVRGDNTPIVVGIVIAGLLVAAAIVIAVFMVIRCRGQRPQSDTMTNGSPSSGQSASVPPSSDYCNLNKAYYENVENEATYSELNI